MRKVPVESVLPGMVLGRSVYNERGDPLLIRGVVLTDQFIQALREHGFPTVYVRDGIADDVEPPELLSPKVRAITFRHLHGLFAVIGSAATIQDEREQKEMLALFAEAARPQFMELYRDVEEIIEDVATADTLSGINSLKGHDNYTFEHSLEVTVAGVMLGKRLLLGPRDLQQLALGCLCHDIGKLIVPQSVLGKPTRLSREEFALVQRHPQAGYETVQHLMGASDITARHVVRQHHERQDGTGYPRGLKGSNRLGAGRSSFGQSLILPAAEVAAVADVYSALASDRPYRPAMNTAEIVSTLQGMAGTHLNREIVTRFLSILPSYPVGTEIVVISHKLRGFRGIVTNVSASSVHHPTVRLLFDPHGRTVAPFEVDTSKERDVEIATSSYAQLVGFHLTLRSAAAGSGV